MRSTGIKGVVFVVTLAFLHDLVRGDTELTCVLMESCILPCKFHAGDDVVIHWIHVTAGDTYVHSFYHDEDQLKNQGQRFRNRTSLFKEQIPRGNASLRLTRVETEDQGKYKCLTSIPVETQSRTSFVNLKVEGGSDNKNTAIITGVVSGILVLGIIGGLTGFCLRRQRNQRLDGAQQNNIIQNELTITCLSSEECVLPCQFASDGKGARVMWYKKKAVVSCTRYGNTSFVVGHNSPADKYKGRTDLYADQVLEGNASLVMKNITPNDQGKYFCITMTAPRTDESGIITLFVKALVQEVDIEFTGDSVTCRAEGIYPEPTLTWSTDPPTDTQLFRNQTKSQKNKFGFYNIRSSLKLRECDVANQTFICSVTSDTSKKTAFLKHEASILASPGSNAMVPCSLSPSTLQSFNLTWRFRSSDPILSISFTGQKSSVKVWDQWKPHVFNDLDLQSLHLQDLKAEHEGTYTCEVRAPEETYITWTDVTVAYDSEYIYIYVIIALCYFLCMSYGMVVFLSCKVRRLEKARRQEETPNEVTEILDVAGGEGDLQSEENTDEGCEEAKQANCSSE
ncbi:HERV-H LTR-associating protein 2 [Nibea albiflora]|uniref:HERV-H LTR-associating protein 2 n=1 Tax=Nibea albiflora TaxID=240163 RepID=A0ACB7F985_NIBAL|nr:HERV-H LTR-associating protein 2 [Nibea albiflora]